MMRRWLSLAFLVAVLAAPLWARDWVHPFDFPQSDNAPQEFYALIEIPAGSFIKYELDSDTGYVVVDRFQSMPVVYPANYGSVPQTLGGDGDPLDVLVLTRTPLHPGVFIKVRPIGVLETIDGGEVDDKIIAVPASKIDPTYDPLKEATDLPPVERERIEAFFRVYKQLPEGRKKVELKGWGSAERARHLLSEALSSYGKKGDG